MYIILLSVHMHINNLYICYTLLSPRFLYFLIHFAWALIGVGKSVGNNILLFSINSFFFSQFRFCDLRQFGTIEFGILIFCVKLRVKLIKTCKT